ncbi:MAG: DUF4388 domain-containing protein [Acidimicrobiia bacterium]
MSLSTLNGTFSSFALPDVLRLVAVSGETGLLRVESPAIAGRVFVVDGAIVYATTRSGDDLIDDLARLERITDEERDAIERRAVSLEDVRDTRKEVLDVFFRHQVSEVLVRLLTIPDGEFSFAHGVMMTHLVGFRFEVEDALSVASDRRSEWDDIRRFIPNVETPFRMADTIGETATIDPERWVLLAMLPQARSARGLAGMLKIFEFEAAKQLSGLVGAGLIVEDRSGAGVTVMDEASGPQDAAPVAGEDAMTADEAAELLGSFIALSDSKTESDSESDKETDKPVEDDDEAADDEDLTNRWRRLRTTRITNGK